jgi:hypothetical protein
MRSADAARYAGTTGLNGAVKSSTEEGIVMQRFRIYKLFAATLFATAVSIAAAATNGADPALLNAVASSARNPKAMARDAVRHPVEELTFFGITPTMTVVEL